MCIYSAMFRSKEEGGGLNCYRGIKKKSSNNNFKHKGPSPFVDISLDHILFVNYNL